MTTELTNTKKIPSQLTAIFKDASEEEQALIKSCYTGPNDNPSFQEWLESYQQNKLLQQTTLFEERGKNISADLEIIREELKVAVDEGLDEKSVKKLTKEVRRLESLLGHNESHWLYLHQTLAKWVQTQLHREVPRKVEHEHSRLVTPADVAQLVRDAKKQALDVEFEEVKE